MGHAKLVEGQQEFWLQNDAKELQYTVRRLVEYEGTHSASSVN